MCFVFVRASADTLAGRSVLQRWHGWSFHSSVENPVARSIIPAILPGLHDLVPSHENRSHELLLRISKVNYIGNVKDFVVPGLKGTKNVKRLA